MGCGNTDGALIQAAKGGNVEAAKHAIAEGADVNDIAHEGGWGNPLHCAAMYDHKEIAELLIAKAADVNAKVASGLHQGWTPLHWAANQGHKETAKRLIAKGADVNANDRGGSTPLHYATREGHKETIELLIANGADVNAKDNDGKTPLDFAILFEHPEIADLLRKHGGKTGEELKAEAK
jgi:ankyrin repeat protein